MPRRDVRATDGRKIAVYDDEKDELEIKDKRGSIYTIDVDAMRKGKPKRARAKSPHRLVRND